MYSILIQYAENELNILLKTNVWPIDIIAQAFPTQVYTKNQSYIETIELFLLESVTTIKYLNEVHHVVNQNNSELIFVMCEAMSHIVDVCSSQYIAWHGGLVTCKGCTIAILAGTRTGKSTLIGNLIADNRYQYLSDDIVLYDELKKRVIPFPIPLKLRSTEFVPESIRDTVIAKGYNSLSNEMEFYIESKLYNIKSNTLNDNKLDAFVLLNRIENGKIKINRLEYQESTKQLILNSRKPGYIYIKQMIKVAPRIAREIPMYIITYITSNDGKELIDSLIAYLLHS